MMMSNPFVDSDDYSDDDEPYEPLDSDIFEQDEGWGDYTDYDNP